MGTAYTYCSVQDAMVSVSQTCDTCENCANLRTWHKRKYVPRPIRREVFKRDNYTCVQCGKKSPDVILSIDHIVSASLGGMPTMDNLQTLCTACNAAKNASEDIPKYFQGIHHNHTHTFKK